MKFITAAGLALCMAPSVLSSAIPVPADTVLANTSPNLDKRVTPLTPPRGDVTCLGYTVKTDDLLAAINQGLGWAVTGVQMGKSNYPHIYNNYESLTFANCVGSTLWEYPVLRYGSNPWVPAKGTSLPSGPNGEREPDRVIFVATSATEVTYCGTITHDPTKTNNKGKLGAFVPCIE